MSENKNIDHHFNTQVNINNYNKIKNHPNLIIFDINDMPEIFKGYHHNVSKLSNNVVIENLSNVKIKDIKISLLNKESFLSSLELIKEIYTLDYKIFEKHNYIY